MVNGKIHLNVSNTGNEDQFIYKDEISGILDLRSVAYYHINRDNLQRCLHQIFIYLSEQQSQDFDSTSKQ